MTSSTPVRRVLAGLALALTGVFIVESPVAALDVEAATVAELRAHIDTINANPGSGPHTIELTASEYVIPCPAAGTGDENANVNGDFDLDTDDSVRIWSASRAVIAINQRTSTCTTERIFDLSGDGTIQLENLRLTDGDLTTVPGGILASGGAIRARSGTDAQQMRLDLDGVLIDGNRAGDGTKGGAPLGGYGGGVYLEGVEAVITDSEIIGNRAGDGSSGELGGDRPGNGGSGGGIATDFGSNLTIRSSTVAANRAGDGGDATGRSAGRGGSGGGILAPDGALRIEFSTIGGPDPSDGNATGVGGSSDTNGGGQSGSGGGVDTFATAVVLVSTFSNNVASDGLAGTGTGSGGAGGDAGAIASGESLRIEASEFSFNRAGSGGPSVDGAAGRGGRGGALHVRGSGIVIDSAVTDNRAGDGGTASASGTGALGGSGGGLNFEAGDLTVRSSTIARNTAGAGGSSNSGQGGGAGAGGGLSVSGRNTIPSTLDVTDARIVDNRVGLGGAGSPAGPGGIGGGVRVDFYTATATISRSVIARNVATAGGGLSLTEATTMLENVTVDANVARLEGGGISAFSGGTVRLVSSTVSSNEAAAGGAQSLVSTTDVEIASTVFHGAFDGPHCQFTGSVADEGNNIEQVMGSAGTCTANTVDSLNLGPLQGNGGVTETRLPAPDGPLVDAVLPAACESAVDQRDTARPQGSGCDIGAVELRVDLTAVDDTATVGDGDTEIVVLANDVTADVPLDAASVRVVREPTSGSAAPVGTTGRVRFTSSVSGADSFDYEVCLLGVPTHCDTATVEIDVTVPDTTPEPFVFVDRAGVVPGSVLTSNAITVAGVNRPTPISVVGGVYSINGGTYTALAGNVLDGDQVRVRHTASGVASTATDTTLTIGGVSDTFTSTTKAADPGTDPDPEVVPDGASRFVALSPVRLFDTRDGTGLPAAGKIAAGATLDVQVGGEAGVPTNASAVVINLTVDQVEGPGFVTAFPAGGSLPNASTLNVTQPGQVRPNLAVVPLNDDGVMSAYAFMATHLIGDVTGYYVETDEPVAAGRFVPLNPQRVFDTRADQAPPGPKGFVGADSSISVQVAGVAGVPASGVSAVVMNVTATESAGPNFITVWPSGGAQPGTSALNLATGETTANLVMMPLGDGGMVDFYTLAGAHLLGDVTGYITDGSAPVDTTGLFVPVTPDRVFDTREDQTPPGPKGYVDAGQTISTQTAGVAGIPADAAAAVLNVTATEAPVGFVTAFPSGTSLPNSSTLNLLGPSDTRANAAMLPIGANGGIDYFVLSGADLIADTTGYYLS